MTTYVILELQLNILRIFSRWASSILLKSLISASRFADMGLDDSTAVPSESPTYDRFCELVAHATRPDDNIIRIYNERATDIIYSYILVLISRANLRVHSYTYSRFAQNFSSLSQQRIDRIEYRYIFHLQLALAIATGVHMVSKIRDSTAARRHSIERTRIGYIGYRE